MGRPPKPIDSTIGEYTKKVKQERQEAEKEIIGNVDNDKLKTAPNSLTRKGKAIYRALIDELDKSGINITNLDIYLLEVLANAIDMMRTAQEKINKEGHTIEYTNKGGNTNITHQFQGVV